MPSHQATTTAPIIGAAASRIPQTTDATPPRASHHRPWLECNRYAAAISSPPVISAQTDNRITKAKTAAAVFAFVILLSVWALITGGLEIAAAYRLHSSHGRWWLALGGVASVVWGILLAAAPMIGAVVVAWWLGIYAIIFGASLLACAWRLRARRPGVPGNGAVRI